MPPRNPGAAAAAQDETFGEIVINRIEEASVTIPIIGLTPIIPHKWSEKALGMMRAKQFGEPAERNPPKDPVAEADAAMYRLPAAPADEEQFPKGYPAMPATAFKGALVGACRLVKNLPMTQAKTLLFVVGSGPEQLVRLYGTEKMREDTPRNATGVVDLRYRTMLLGSVDDPEGSWRADIEVRFPPSLLKVESVVNLMDAAGRGGVGDWRPAAPKSHTGSFGRFKVDDSRSVRRS